MRGWQCGDWGHVLVTCVFAEVVVGLRLIGLERVQVLVVVLRLRRVGRVEGGDHRRPRCVRG